MPAIASTAKEGCWILSPSHTKNHRSQSRQPASLTAKLRMTPTRRQTFGFSSEKLSLLLGPTFSCSSCALATGQGWDLLFFHTRPHFLQWCSPSPDLVAGWTMKKKQQSGSRSGCPAWACVNPQGCLQGITPGSHSHGPAEHCFSARQLREPSRRPRGFSHGRGQGGQRSGTGLCLSFCPYWSSPHRAHLKKFPLSSLSEVKYELCTSLFSSC